MVVDMVITTTTITARTGTILRIGKRTRTDSKAVTNHQIRRNDTLLGRRNNLNLKLILLTLSLLSLVRRSAQTSTMKVGHSLIFLVRIVWAGLRKQYVSRL
jgi:hypothetical protein